MTEGQRLIKGIATGAAVVLTIIIITSVLGGIFGALRIFSGKSRGGKDFSQEYQERITSLEVENDAGNLIIREGDSFRVEGQNVEDSFECQVKGNNTLVVKNVGRRSGIFGFINFGSTSLINSVLEITIPKGWEMKDISVSSGLGEVSIEQVTTGQLQLDLGVGNCRVDTITAEAADINAGVGDVHFSNVVLADVEVSTGVGQVSMEGTFRGKVDVDAGVGNAEFKVRGREADYDLILDPGAGGVYVNGSKAGEVKHSNRSAEYSIKIDGGVGKISLEFSED